MPTDPPTSLRIPIAIYRHYVYNNQCRRVFLACCHDNGYVAELTQYQKDVVAGEKTTLIEHAQQGKQYAGLPFGSTNFRGLFMRESLSPHVPKRPVATPHKSETNNDGAMQAFSYSKAAKDFPIVIPDRTKSAGPSPTPATTTPYTDGPSGGGVSLNNVANGAITRSSTDVPINRYGERVDKRLSPFSNTDKERFENRVSKQKLCNEHHLRHSCAYYDSCYFDHGEIDPGVLLALR